jgi:hypothetical protein
MEHHLFGPFWGNVIIIGLAGAVTLGCFAAMFWMMLRPGETEQTHPKYSILRDDR